MRTKHAASAALSLGLLASAVLLAIAIPADPAAAAVGTVYGPYTVTKAIASNSSNQTISGSGGVYEVTAGNYTITVDTGTTNVLVLIGGTRNAQLTGLNIEGTANVTLYLAANTTTTYITANPTSSPTAGQNCAGIQVAPTATLTIDGPGTLDVTGASYCAGIGGIWVTGGGGASQAGTVAIENGTVNATGGAYAAAIGGGYLGFNSAITINAGTVNATGGDYAAALGTGTLAGYNPSAGEPSTLGITPGLVTINGGTVTATAGDLSAGIGGGNRVPGIPVTITGGSVTATGGAGGGAGIGGGGDGQASTYTASGKGSQGHSGDTVTITGGSVTARSQLDSAAIGGGFWSDGGTTTISGGVVNAEALNGGAGIGGGAHSPCGTIAISGGTITATATSQAAGIGNGVGNGVDAKTGDPVSVSGGTIAISGGTIVATSSDNATPGIGGGIASTGEPESPTVTISSGSVYSVNPAGMVQEVYTPTNGSVGGNRSVYLIQVLMADESGTALANTDLSINVTGTAAYTYTATTNAQGIVWAWLPSGTYTFLSDNSVNGTYFDWSLTVAVPANPTSYDPASNTGTIAVVTDDPQWSFTENLPAGKVYGSAGLDLDIVHNNPGSNPAKAIAGVLWYRESARTLTNTQATFAAGYAAAGSGNSGAGGAGAVLNLVSSVGANEKHYVLNADRNGRYWIQIHYVAANTGQDVYHVTYLDVGNVYTPVAVYVQDWDANTGAPATGYVLQTAPPQYGIPQDIDGTVLPAPLLGYDTVSYARNPAMPAPRWVMDVPGAPFATTAQDASSSAITLDANTWAHEDTAPAGDAPAGDATDLYYTVSYRDTTPDYAVTYRANGGTGSDYVQDSGVNSGTTSIVTATLDATGFAGPAGTPVLTGWSLDATGDGSWYAPGAPLTVTGNVTLYAQWAPVTLTVSETVTGTLGDLTRQFILTIHLQDATGTPLTGALPYTGGATDGAVTPADGTLDFTAGVATVMLTHGQSITLTGAPLEGSVEIAETPVPGYTTTFTDSAATDAGTTDGGTSDDAGATDDAGGSSHDTGLLPMAPDRVIAFVNARSDVPATGAALEDIGTPLVLTALALGLVLAATGAVRRRWNARG